MQQYGPPADARRLPPERNIFRSACRRVASPRPERTVIGVSRAPVLHHRRRSHPRHRPIGHELVHDAPQPHRRTWVHDDDGRAGHDRARCADRRRWSGGRLSVDGPHWRRGLAHLRLGRGRETRQWKREWGSGHARFGRPVRFDRQRLVVDAPWRRLWHVDTAADYGVGVDSTKISRPRRTERLRNHAILPASLRTIESSVTE